MQTNVGCTDLAHHDINAIHIFTLKKLFRTAFFTLVRCQTLQAKVSFREYKNASDNLI